MEVTVTRPGSNATSPHRERFELLDTGSGDPDLMRGDGIYSRYFSPETGGPGVYTFEITVTDNGNTAYSWTHDDVASLAAELPLRLGECFWNFFFLSFFCNELVKISFAFCWVIIMPVKIC